MSSDSNKDYSKYVIRYDGKIIAENQGKRGLVFTVLNIVFDDRYLVSDSARKIFFEEANEKKWIIEHSVYLQEKQNHTDKLRRFFEKEFIWKNEGSEIHFNFRNQWGIGNIEEFLAIVKNTFQGQEKQISWEVFTKKSEDAPLQKEEEPAAPALSRQMIYFGAPGTGKSFLLQKEAEKNFQHPERVTFYPGYSYQQFVGTYKPHMNGEKIEYEFVPGPLLRTLVKALKAKQAAGNGDPQKFLLIIEELNRAEAAAVFGDLFQLLDRNKEGVSEYPVSISEDLKDYLVHAGICDRNSDFELIFPENFYIWTTMNSADQGVFPLDTAFKRRWEFKYIGINDNEKLISKTMWNEFRKEINSIMLDAGVNEDKLMGPFFLKESEMRDDVFVDNFCGKVLLYLFEDAMRLKRNKIFKPEYCKSYSELCRNFRDNQAVFIHEKISLTPDETEFEQDPPVPSAPESSDIQNSSSAESLHNA